MGAGTAKSTSQQVLFLLTITRSGRLAEISRSVCISKSQRTLCISFQDGLWVVHIPLVCMVKFKFHRKENEYVVIYLCHFIYRTLAWWLECLPRTRETWVHSHVESYQRLKKWYLMPLCLTLSIIRHGSRIKWGNPGKGAAPSPTPSVVAIEKGASRSPSATVANFTFSYIWLETYYSFIFGYIDYN